MAEHGPITVAVVGGGGRGTSNARRIRDAGGIVVAVAEPVGGRLERLGDEHGVPRSFRFTDWRELAAVPRCADAVLITTQDADHADPCVALAGLGYHIMCEKPMATTEADAERMAAAVDEAGVLFAVFHSLRYSGYTRALRDILADGRIGQIISVQHLEPVGWWHFAHSYVRGSWRREDESGPLLMTKCSHDLDWLGFLVGSRPSRVSSFGRLTHFRPENRPEGASSRCVTCAVEPECPYSAPRLYRSRLGDPLWDHWPLGAVVDIASEDSLADALRDGPYGRCVYDCDNDVVDHQVVALDYANGVTATHTVTAFTEVTHRKTRIFGTHGSIDGDGHEIVLQDFRSTPEPVRQVIPLVGGPGRDPVGAHDDGDRALVAAFLEAVRTGDPTPILSGPEESVDSHRIVWAAERARRESRVVEL